MVVGQVSGNRSFPTISVNKKSEGFNPNNSYLLNLNWSAVQDVLKTDSNPGEELYNKKNDFFKSIGQAMGGLIKWVQPLSLYALKLVSLVSHGENFNKPGQPTPSIEDLSENAKASMEAKVGYAQSLVGCAEETKKLWVDKLDNHIGPGTTLNTDYPNISTASSSEPPTSYAPTHKTNTYC